MHLVEKCWSEQKNPRALRDLRAFVSECLLSWGSVLVEKAKYVVTLAMSLNFGMHPILILSKAPILVEAFHGFPLLFQMNNALKYATTTPSFQINFIYHIIRV